MLGKTWDKVTITWDCYFSGFQTQLHTEGHLDPNLGLYDGDAHEIRKIRAASVYSENSGGQRIGEIEFKIGVRRNVAPNRDAILRLVKAEFAKRVEDKSFANYPGIKGPATVCWTDTRFVVSYVLANGEQFCDMAIEIVRAVFIALGVNDKNDYNLARFNVVRETFVRVDDSWMTFNRWLRSAHRLPIRGPEDDPWAQRRV